MTGAGQGADERTARLLREQLEIAEERIGRMIDERGKLRTSHTALLREVEGLRKALVTLSNVSWDAEDVRCFALDALEAALSPASGGV